MTAIRLDGLTKSFNHGAPILSSLNLRAEPGERLAIVGPSGAGKTTLLRLIAGFETPDSGKIFFGDRDVTHLPPEQRDVGFVFQSHALYPHLTVQENLEFSLRLRKIARDEIANRVREVSAVLTLSHLLNRHPPQLSGGEAQRVALGRALIRKPSVLLMDEPLSSLPPDLRLRLRHEIVKLHQKDPLTILYVTHDHEEALAIGQRVAVLHAGAVQQIGTPRQIYERPANQFVAAFVGRPPMNFIEVRKADYPGAVTGIRPEHFEICSESEALFTAPIETIHYGGFHSDMVVRFNGAHITVRHFGNLALKIGDSLPLRVRPEHMHMFDQSGNRLES